MPVTKSHDGAYSSSAVLICTIGSGFDQIPCARAMLIEDTKDITSIAIGTMQDVIEVPLMKNRSVLILIELPACYICVPCRCFNLDSSVCTEDARANPIAPKSAAPTLE